ncbi:hypothetical protein BDY19DRAFT_908235 [Irpex rosettiformis]|uniref:Uncharacterized protein n=1 Tax=Irpex rosettiformis TaxID=378272 RepID=A0ACB8TX67_9APHY|nr:hypothetical protein BDY19DRAFT_908235 [Irpex rosettiformis]
MGPTPALRLSVTCLLPHVLHSAPCVLQGGRNGGAARFPPKIFKTNRADGRLLYFKMVAKESLQGGRKVTAASLPDLKTNRADGFYYWLYPPSTAKPMLFNGPRFSKVANSASSPTYSSNVALAYRIALIGEED